MADLKKELQQVIDEMQATMGKPDAALKFYTDDCRLLAPGMEMITGKEGVKALMEHFAKMIDKVDKSKGEVVEAVGMGDSAASVTKGTIYGKDGSVIDKTKSITIWKKTGDGWKVQSSCFNSDKQANIPTE